MQENFPDDLLCLVARLYYQDGLSQMDVAKFVHVSQAKVSRLLAMARQRGIVTISVADYEPRDRDTEIKLKNRFKLGEVYVIKAAKDLDKANLRRTMGHFGGSILSHLIRRNYTVALAGGRTIYELVQRLPRDGSRAITVVQTMGSIDFSVSQYDAIELSRVMADRLGGQYHSLNAPAFMASKAARNSLLSHEQVKRVMETMESADIAVVGIGTLEDSLFSERGILDAKEVAALRRAGAVGEVCGRFFDKEGRECDTRWKDVVIGIELESLRKCPRVIGVVSGEHRAEAILPAVNSGLVKGVIIDQAGAEKLLEYASQESSEG